MELLIDQQGPVLRGHGAGRTPASAYGLLGGIAIGCLADLPIILGAGGLRVGRFIR